MDGGLSQVIEVPKEALVKHYDIPLRSCIKNCTPYLLACSFFREKGGYRSAVYACDFFAGDLYPARRVFRMMSQCVIVFHQQFDAVAVLLAVGQHFVQVLADIGFVRVRDGDIGRADLIAVNAYPPTGIPIRGAGAGSPP